MNADRIWGVLLLISLVAVFFALRPAVPPPPERPALRRLFGPEVRVDDWVAIEIDDGARVRRLAPGTSWSPGQRDALRLFRNARLERPVATGEDRTRYGLSPPAFVVRLVARGGDSARAVLEVGDVAPDAMSVYVATPRAVRARQGEAIPEAEISKLPIYQIENLEELLPR